MQALTCINELVEKNLMPPQMRDFVIKVALSALGTLQALVGPAVTAQDRQLRQRQEREVAGRLGECAEGFVNQYTRFLCVFLRQHL